VPDQHFIGVGVHLFGHGGAVFWAVTETVFTSIYVLAWVARASPEESCRRLLPNAFLTVAEGPAGLGRQPLALISHALQALGASALACGASSGLCLAEIGSFLYVCGLFPWVWLDIFGPSPSAAAGATRGGYPPTLLFSYSAQVDVDHLDDQEVAVDGPLPSSDEMQQPPILRH